jgi:hypothetical protein
MCKTYQFKLSVEDDNYDACGTANIKISGREILQSGIQRCYDGSTLLRESSRSYMLAYYLCAYVLLLCVSFNLISCRMQIKRNTLNA